MKWKWMLRTFLKGKIYHTKSRDHTAPSPFPAAPPLSHSVWDSGNLSFPWGCQKECGQALGKAIPCALHGGWVLGPWDGDQWFLRGIFPGGPVVKTLHFQCWDCRFNLWSGNQDSTCGWAQSKKKKKKKAVFFGFPWRPASRGQSGGWEGFASNMPLRLLSPPRSFLPKHPPTGQGNISCPPKEQKKVLTTGNSWK